MELDNKKIEEEIEKFYNNEDVGEGFIEGLLRAKYICPVKVEKNENRIAFGLIKDEEGNIYVLAFTSEEEIKKWDGSSQEDVQYIIQTFKDYAVLLEENLNVNGFVINVTGKSYVVTRELITQIMKGSEGKVIEKGDEIIFESLGDCPEELIEELQKTFKSMEILKKAYLVRITHNGQKGYLCVIDANGREAEISVEIATYAYPYTEGLEFNLLPLDCDLGKQVADNFEPIHIKK